MRDTPPVAAIRTQLCDKLRVMASVFLGFLTAAGLIATSALADEPTAAIE